MRILLTGADGFTGKHFSQAAMAAGHEVLPFSGDITDFTGVNEAVHVSAPTHVLHLAGISAVHHRDENAFYTVNLFGTLNLLKALTLLPRRPFSVVLASSATVYGNVTHSPISESEPAQPVNHYAMSKLAMEMMAKTYADRLPVVISRPFNYIGVGQEDHFVIPKIVRHFAQHTDTIELGNIDVEREFNDVRTVVDAYIALLNKGVPGEVYNLCSGCPVSLTRVIQILEAIAGYKIKVTKNSTLVRSNEISRLCGNPAKLESCIGPLGFGALEDTLRWIYESDRQS